MVYSSPWAEPLTKPVEELETFLVMCPDAPSPGGAKRLEFRTEHSPGVVPGYDIGWILVAGATYSDGTRSYMNGSYLMIREESMENARERVLRDLFATTGTWDVDKITVTAIKPHQTKGKGKAKAVDQDSITMSSDDDDIATGPSTQARTDASSQVVRDALLPHRNANIFYSPPPSRSHSASPLASTSTSPSKRVLPNLPPSPLRRANSPLKQSTTARVSPKKKVANDSDEYEPEPNSDDSDGDTVIASSQPFLDRSTQSSSDLLQLHLPNRSPVRTTRSTSKTLSLSRSVTPTLTTPSRLTPSPSKKLFTKERDPSSSPLSSLPPSPSVSPMKRRAEDNHLPPFVRNKGIRHKFAGVHVELRDEYRLPRALGGAVGPSMLRKKRAGKTKDDVKGKGWLESEEEEEESEEEEDSDSSSSSSSSSSEDEDVVALLARAAERRANGTQLLATSETSNQHSPERRSTRVVPPKAAEKKKDLDLLSGLTTRNGRMGIEGLMREKVKSEKVVDQWEKAKKLMEESDDMLDLTDDEDEIAPLTETDVDKLAAAAAILPTIGEDDDDWLPTFSPQKREAQTRAAQIKEVLKADLGGASEAREEIDEARVVWTMEVIVAKKLGWEKEAKREGWVGRVGRSLREGARRADGFESPMLLFGRLAGVGSEEERREVADWLLTFVGSPVTPGPSADRAVMLLSRIISHTAQTTTYPSTLATDAPTRCPLLSALHFGAQLAALGAKDGLVELPTSVYAQEKQTIETKFDSLMKEVLEGSGEEELGVVVSRKKRDEVVRRLVKVAGDLAGARLLSGPELVGLIVAFVKIGLDPTSAPLRGSLEPALQHLVDSIDLPDCDTRASLFNALHVAFGASPPRTQLEVLRILPHQSKGSKILRKWLAIAFLVRPADNEAFVDPSAFDRSPPIDAVLETLKQSRDGPLDPATDNHVLLHNAMILSLALSDLGEELLLLSPSVREVAQRQLVEVRRAVERADSRIRTDVKAGDPARNRAKNAVMRLHHSLKYQHNVATQNRGKNPFFVEEKRLEDGLEASKVGEEEPSKADVVREESRTPLATRSVEQDMEES
ncbi:hypothetical protein MNV49_005929 [Pseudohyphozyma bogoriensis]|nr:hypothetical protein MNV49_005929 [Pseudohyphozyma bogoriensis]